MLLSLLLSADPPLLNCGSCLACCAVTVCCLGCECRASAEGKAAAAWALLPAAAAAFQLRKLSRGWRCAARTSLHAALPRLLLHSWFQGEVGPGRPTAPVKQLTASCSLNGAEKCTDDALHQVWAALPAFCACLQSQMFEHTKIQLACTCSQLSINSTLLSPFWCRFD